MRRFFLFNRKPSSKLDWFLSWSRGLFEIVDGMVRLITLGRISSNFTVTMILKQMEYLSGLANEDEKS